MDNRRIHTPEMQEFEKVHIARVRALAPECMVLLKNDGTLPLKHVGRLALYGSGARRTVKGGTGSGDVNVRHAVSVEEGLENAGVTITTKAWLDAYDNLAGQAKRDYFAQVRRQADALGVEPRMFAMGRVAPEPDYDLPLDGEGDTAVYVLARVSGEGTDRSAGPGDVQLSEAEIRDILRLREKYPRFVLVLNTGGMVDLRPVLSVGAILQMGQLGTPGGDALADVLFGKSYPSGKLTTTWAPIEAYPSTEGFGDPNDTAYTEGVYAGYRYFDSVGYEPTFPFGFGLGYTDFTVTATGFAADAERVTVTVEVKNTGVFAGKEVVQVYYSAPPGKLDQPYQALAAYAKTKELRPGKSETLEISFPTDAMTSYDTERAAYVMEQGVYYIRVGNSSRNTRIAGAVALERTAVIRQVKNTGGQPGFADRQIPLRPISAEEEAERAAAPVVTIPAEALKTSEAVYSAPPREIPAGPVCTWEDVRSGQKTLDEFVAGLTDEELTSVCIGNDRESAGFLDAVENASAQVAGAAGETTAHLRGVPSLILADGPAGLRLSAEYKIADGKVVGSAALGGDMLLVLTPEERRTAEAEVSKAAGETCYQYCAAIPIGTEIAQSWNDALAGECGDLVGEEMERFGVSVWLAPAMNIHRSPLCGRDFEYFSEDPVLSGRMAAAITRGVQAHEGRAATIKHFVGNNQETNRFYSNSRISERALREIYLKGFEICVKTAQPRFVMTSYNLLNGEHTCNRRDLVTGVLRDEWGFRGVVMTDWVVTVGLGVKGEKWPCASAAGCVKAGNDLTMPGLPPDRADILDALRREDHPYALSRAALQACAKRVLGAVLSQT